MVKLSGSAPQTVFLEQGPARDTITPNWVMGWKDWSAVLGAALGAFMAILDIQITNASLREIQGALSLDFSEGGWISTAYLIAEVMVIPLTGFFSKVFGMRRYILVNCIIFLAASLLCGMAWDLRSMIAFRVLQGLSGGILIPMSFQTMLLFMPPERKNVGLAIFGMTATLAPTLGPSLGGWLTENFGWRSIFLINLLPGALMTAAIRYGMPDAKMSLERLKKMDFGGVITLCIGLGALTYLLEDGARLDWFSDEAIRLCTLASVITLPLFVYIQFTRQNPLLNLRLFADRNFGLSASITLLTAMALYGGIYSLSLYLGGIQGYGAMQIGQVMMWVGIPQLFVMPLLPTLMKKFDLRALALAGMLLFIWSNLLNSNLNLDYGGDQFAFSLVLRAIGQPLFMIPLSAMAMARISPAEAGNASSIYNVMRNVGGSFGIALAGSALVSRQGFHFAMIQEHLSLHDAAAVEHLFGTQRILASTGMDAQSSQISSLAYAVGNAQRDATILSFSDNYYILAMLLILCCVLIFALKKVNVSGNSSSSLH